MLQLQNNNLQLCNTQK